MDYVKREDIKGFSFEDRQGFYCVSCIENDPELRQAPLDSVFFDDWSDDELEPGHVCQRCGKEIS